MSLDDKWCIVYVDAIVTDEQLAKNIAEVLGGAYERQCVSAGAIELDIESNEDFDAVKRLVKPDGFLHFRYRVEIDYPSSRLSEVRDAVSKLLASFWVKKIPAVAACDFEEDLPHLGGIQFPDDALPWPK